MYSSQLCKPSHCNGAAHGHVVIVTFQMCVTVQHCGSANRKLTPSVFLGVAVNRGLNVLNALKSAVKSRNVVRIGANRER